MRNLNYWVWMETWKQVTWLPSFAKEGFPLIFNKGLDGFSSISFKCFCSTCGEINIWFMRSFNSGIIIILSESLFCQGTKSDFYGWFFLYVSLYMHLLITMIASISLSTLCTSQKLWLTQGPNAECQGVTSGHLISMGSCIVLLW